MSETDSDDGSGPIRVLLVDDHVVLRDGLQALLAAQQDLVVVGAVSTGADALRLAAAHAPDVVVLDLRLPDRNGIYVARDLRQHDVRVGILILTGHGTPQHVRAARRVGVAGFLPKETAGGKVVEALRVVARGGTAFDPSIDPAVATRTAYPLEGMTVEPLSERELDVLRLVATGARNRAIGARLGISERTVEVHVGAILGKLGVGSRMEAATTAGQLGLV
jgi:DNA-binding NarL/FixJ family response regulator